MTSKFDVSSRECDPLTDLARAPRNLFRDPLTGETGWGSFWRFLKDAMRYSPFHSYFIGKLWMRLFGWKWAGEIPRAPRYVMIAAPHTSNWDLPFMLAVSFVMRVRLRWMGKHTIFRGPLGWFFRLLGGIPVDRRTRGNYVEKVAETIRNAESSVLVVAPEGTRKMVEYWRTGFYYIALRARVPIVCGYLDFKNRVGGIGPVIEPTGDIHSDLDKIKVFYEGIVGRFPEKMMSEIRFRYTEPAVESERVDA